MRQSVRTRLKPPVPLKGKATDTAFRFFFEKPISVAHKNYLGGLLSAFIRASKRPTCVHKARAGRGRSPVRANVVRPGKLLNWSEKPSVCLMYFRSCENTVTFVYAPAIV